MEYYLGIDLGGTNIAVGVVNEQFEIVGRGSRKTAAPRETRAIVDDMAAACFDAVSDAGLTMEDITSCGVGSPGAIVPATGVVVSADNLGFKNVPLADMLRERTGKEFYVENDANAAAYGEYLAGAGKGTTDFVAVTLGTGVGGGVILNGQIYAGHNHCGAELGHMIMVMDGEQCSCGQKGCFEAYASATALIRQTKAAMREHPDSLMWKLVDGQLDMVSGRTSFDAAQAGDAAAAEVVDRYERYLATGIVSVINLLQPQRLCVGGGISNQKEKLMEPVRRYVYDQVYVGGTDCELMTAVLGNDAGIIGAAFLFKTREGN